MAHLHRLLRLNLYLHGREGGIRTHGTLLYDGFQDRFLKPLGHLSEIINILLLEPLTACLTTEAGDSRFLERCGSPEPSYAFSTSVNSRGSHGIC